VLKIIANDIASHGGKAFYVGGYVRDKIMEIAAPDGEDIDIEVYFLNIEELQSILSNYGTTHLIGKSFPVVKISGHPEWDFTLPAKSDHSFAEACGRRDFTINSMMMDILSGEIIDIYGGREDVKNRIIMHTNEKNFKDDPLRVYRAFQFAARLDFSLHLETIEIIKKTDLKNIASTRIYEELKKLLMLSPQPSIGLRYMEKTNVLERMHPLLYKLIGCEQSPLNHPEGDVWEHTLLVVDQAARLRPKSLNPEALMFASLVHDIGKPQTTKVKGDKVTAYGHDVLGEKLALSFLQELTNKTTLINAISVLVREHMHPVLLYKDRERVSDKAIRKLVNRVNLKELLLISEADFKGRALERDFDVIRSWFLQKVSSLGLKLDKKIEPLIKGRDLVQMGLSPGPAFSKTLDYSFELQLEGKGKEEIMQAVEQLKISE
jgi:tRNA nucleotidyltransferase (CCA-adding enzyme)